MQKRKSPKTALTALKAKNKKRDVLFMPDSRKIVKALEVVLSRYLNDRTRLRGSLLDVEEDIHALSCSEATIRQFIKSQRRRERIQARLDRVEFVLAVTAPLYGYFGPLDGGA